jgi:hypothetical protein
MLQVAFKIAIVATVCVIAQIVAKNSYIERSNRPYFCRDFFLGGGETSFLDLAEELITESGRCLRNTEQLN